VAFRIIILYFIEMGLFPTSLIALFSLLLVSVPRAAETLPGPVPAQVVAVVDGDTLSVRAHIWLGQEVATLVRLAGIDTPELKGECESERARARAARDYLERYEKYAGRVMAKVASADGGDLSERMIAAGFARAYDGGKRLPWCQAAEIAKPE
jgi:micrococcal nuclease